MIPNAYRYYGSVISFVLDLLAEPINIRRLLSKHAGFYLLNESLPMYIKYSTSRKGPWTFSFRRAHQELEDHLCDVHGQCVVVFVCGRDGIVALTHIDFRRLLDGLSEDQEAVTIKRKHNEMYQVRGHNGVLGWKLSRNSLDEILFQENLRE